MRAATYARYSSDLQRPNSIEDQLEVCRRYIEKQGWTLVRVYKDPAVSGSSRFRPEYQKLLSDLDSGLFDVVVVEALDRLGRKLADVADLHDRCAFACVKLVAINVGEITAMHVGMLGTVAQLYISDLKEKTWRGQLGRALKGKLPGGKSYGYVVSGTGERGIDEAEATTVRRVFREFAAGRSPRAIAMQLNSDGIPGPNGTSWGPSTIYGNWRRGTGVINNESYIGKLVWNRQHFLKDPKTGKRQARLNPKAEWVIQEVPELRIVDDALWQAVKGRQRHIRHDLTHDGSGVRSERARRPVYLLSNLIKCGSCGGGFSKVSTHHYGCSNARNRGTCNNWLTIRRDVLEASVLSGLKTHLMHPDLMKEFAAEYHRELNRLNASREQAHAVKADEAARVDRQIRALVEAIKDGMRTPSMKQELLALEARKIELAAALEHAPTPAPRLHPRLADIYREKVTNLQDELNRPELRAEAAEAIRSLIEEIRLVPQNDRLEIELAGDLAGILALAAGKKKPVPGGDGLQATLVAGRGFEPPTFRL